MPKPAFYTKDGKKVIIRSAIPEDAKNLLTLKLTYLKDTTTIPLFVHEYSKSIEDEKALITRISEEKNSLLLIAVHEGGIIGNIDLNGNQREKLFHTGVIGMGMLAEWRGLGIGTELLKEVIAWSKENEFLELVWLEVYSNNIGGITLYEKQGFTRCGKISGFFNEGDQKIDKITMVNYLK